MAESKIFLLIGSVKHIYQYWVTPILPIRQIAVSVRLYIQYLSDWFHYGQMRGAEPLLVKYSHPQLFDATPTTGFDTHYFYQAVWAAEKIAAIRPTLHVDVGGDVKFVGMLTTHVPVAFIDIRPIQTSLSELKSVSGSILSLPFDDESIESLSCLHVAEHIGLGRYGDALNPAGTHQACAELTRVLAPGGNLFFSLPVGRPRVCFNAHRIHSPQQILMYFYDLEMVHFAVIDDRGNFREGISPDDIAEANYACGLFHFTKRL